MTSESTTFGLGTLGVVVGLAILLYGVYIDTGQELNVAVIGGGLVILVGMGILTAGVAGLEGGHGTGE